MLAINNITLERILLHSRATSMFTPGMERANPCCETGTPVNENMSRAATALGKLEPAQREAIVLFELHGYAIDEIAEIQQASVSSVKSRLVRGRERLRRVYAGFGEPVALTEEVCRG